MLLRGTLNETLAKSKMFTPKRDDEHPRLFHMGVPPPRGLFRVFYMPLWNRSGIVSSVEGIWLDVPLTRSLSISHNFFAIARKIIYVACSIQAGRFFIGRN